MSVLVFTYTLLLFKATENREIHDNLLNYRLNTKLIVFTAKLKTATAP